MSGITANYLFKKSNRSALKIIIDDLVRTIDNKILTAHESGFSKIEFELPINFTLNNMSVKDAQTLIYSELVTIYKEKDFPDVGLEFRNSKVFFHVKWLNGMSQEERQRRIQIIKKHMIGPMDKE